MKGFCRTNPFKRLESSGHAFILSVERHILRNFICLHAIEKGLPIPIGTQDMGMLDTWANDQDADLWDPAADSDDNDAADGAATTMRYVMTEKEILARAAEVYDTYAAHFRRRFRWLMPEHFNDDLADDLRMDTMALIDMLKKAGAWDANRDRKLQALIALLSKQHPNDKVLVFSQFADTVNYLSNQIQTCGLSAVAGVTGDTEDPTAIVYRFSPVSNERRDQINPAQELRVVLATDVLSEGQNLQDCSIVVNYDLPWAIIRLIQRAGRVDRIGQKSATILCYSFLPAEGVERIIRLRSRVRQRLRENAEVVGTDEMFFEDQDDARVVRDLFTEKAGILDGDEDTEVDLASYAYQIWKNAIDRNPELEKVIPAMPNVVYSTRQHKATAEHPEGVLVYLRTAEGNDALAWIDKDGDCFHLSAALATSCPVSSALLVDPSLVELGRRLNNDLRRNAQRKIIKTKPGDEISYAEFLAWKSKTLIDDIDTALARHYGFTDEELDFIINYDIKYRSLVSRIRAQPARP